MVINPTSSINTGPYKLASPQAQFLREAGVKTLATVLKDLWTVRKAELTKGEGVDSEGGDMPEGGWASRCDWPESEVGGLLRAGTSSTDGESTHVYLIFNSEGITCGLVRSRFQCFFSLTFLRGGALYPLEGGEDAAQSHHGHRMGAPGQAGARRVSGGHAARGGDRRGNQSVRTGGRAPRIYTTLLF